MAPNRALRVRYLPLSGPSKPIAATDNSFMRLIGLSFVMAALLVTYWAARDLSLGRSLVIVVLVGALAGAALLIVARQGAAFRTRAAEITALVDSTADAVIGTTPGGIITSWNGGAESIYGWKATETIGQPLEMIVPLATRDAVAISLRKLALGTTAIHHQAFGLHRDGRQIDVGLTVCPVYVSRRLVGVSHVVRDISSAVQAERERERLLAELAAQNEQLREVDRLKDEFVASVSHELRTPLTSIRGYLELIRDDQVLDDEHDGMLGIVDRNAERLLELVNDLLFSAQVAAGKPVRLALEDVDLAEIVTHAVAAAEPRAEKAAVTLELDAQHATAHGDPRGLAQVTDNLISNAIKFTPKGGTVRVTLKVNEGLATTLIVKDSGVGIAENEQTELFTRFFRTKSATDDAVQGSGLGLSIVKSIVEAHGGTITVESTLGVGTSFTVALPDRLTQAAHELPAQLTAGQT
jgi:PAS domain S-box-containing protein